MMSEERRDGVFPPAQEKLLRRHLARLCTNSQYYRGKLAGLNVAEFRMSDLAKLPLTEKADFSRENDAFLACPQDAVADICRTSGTGGEPTAMYYTQSDLDRLAENECRALSIGGVKSGDKVLLTCTMDRCFVAGLAYYLGARKLGATVIRSGSSPLFSHLDLIRKFRPNTLLGVPSFLLKLAIAAENAGMEPANCGIERLICIGEPLRGENLSPTPLGEALEFRWRAPAISTYASTECFTAFCECELRSGGHVPTELCIAEIVDDDGVRLPPGEIGELVLTPLGVEAMPLLRYRTGDMTFLQTEPCRCRRPGLRIGPILGRKYQMIKCLGTSFYPPVINAVLDALDEVVEYQVEVSGDGLVDRVRILLCLCSDDKLPLVEERLQAALRFKPEIELVSMEVLRERVYPLQSRKAQHLLDLRSAYFAVAKSAHIRRRTDGDGVAE